MSGPTFIGGAFGPTLPDGWELVETGDFNGNAFPDYVLYNAATRQTAIWYLINNVYVSGAFGPTLPAGWNVVGIGDFDGDGHEDYLLFNSGNHQTAIWYLSGPAFIRGAYGPTIASGWILAATADFNGDGHPDYLLYNTVTRRTADLVPQQQRVYQRRVRPRSSSRLELGRALNGAGANSQHYTQWKAFNPASPRSRCFPRRLL